MKTKTTDFLFNQHKQTIMGFWIITECAFKGERKELNNLKQHINRFKGDLNALRLSFGMDKGAPCDNYTDAYFKDGILRTTVYTRCNWFETKTFPNQIKKRFPSVKMLFDINEDDLNGGFDADDPIALTNDTEGNVFPHFNIDYAKEYIKDWPYIYGKPRRLSIRCADEDTFIEAIRKKGITVSGFEEFKKRYPDLIVKDKKGVPRLAVYYRAVYAE